MALIEKIKRQDLQRTIRHKKVDCTYTIVDDNDDKYLQLDTYESEDSRNPAKKGQTVRFSINAIQQLKEIISTEFSEALALMERLEDYELGLLIRQREGEKSQAIKVSLDEL